MSTASLPSFPPTALRPGAALCSAGSLGWWFPNVTALTAALRLLAPRRRLAPRSASSFRISRRLRGLPGSWATLVHVRRSQTPVEEARQDPGRIALRFGSLLSPSAFPTASASTTCLLSGLDVAAHTLAVYASQLPSRTDPRKTRFRLVVLALAGWDLHPRVTTRGFSRYMSSSSPRLVLAQELNRSAVVPRSSLS